MGHWRTKRLPRTGAWKLVVASVQEACESDLAERPDLVKAVADQTLEASAKSLAGLHNNRALSECFRFLVALSVAAQSEDVSAELANIGIVVDGPPTILNLARTLKDYVTRERDDSPDNEFAELATRAATDTITTWIREKSNDSQLGLFATPPDEYSPWREASSGAGFCQLSQNYFGNFTKRYLEFFLDRAASEQLPSLALRRDFNAALEKSTSDIAALALDISGLTQSFSAGWFNKRAIQRLPSPDETSRFLEHALHKIRDEFRGQRESVE